MHQPSIAIVGSGPSGCYLAQSLRKAWPEAAITVFDQLACPFGLVRYGVAADHQNTKAVTRQFERLFTTDNVQFAGNVRIGDDLSLEQLRESFDIVAFATGLHANRSLGVEGDDLDRVYRAGDITRALNAHPEAAEARFDFGDTVTVIGNGNVAIDIVRFLSKLPGDYEGSDVHDPIVEAYTAHPAHTLNVVGRSALAEAKFDAAMIRELGKIDGVRFTSDTDPATVAPSDDRHAQARVDALSELLALSGENPARVTVNFCFGWSPEQITREGDVLNVTFVATPGARDASAELVIQSDSVVTAIGFELEADAAQVFAGTGLNLDPTPETGRLANGLYRTGWFKRGPRGTIPENRSDAKAVAEEIIADWQADGVSGVSAKPGFAALSETVRAKSVSFEQWQRLDQHEQLSANTGRVRQKSTNVRTMIAIAKGEEPK